MIFHIQNVLFIFRRDFLHTKLPFTFRRGFVYTKCSFCFQAWSFAYKMSFLISSVIFRMQNILFTFRRDFVYTKCPFYFKAWFFVYKMFFLLSGVVLCIQNVLFTFRRGVLQRARLLGQHRTVPGADGRAWDEKQFLHLGSDDRQENSAGVRSKTDAGVTRYLQNQVSNFHATCYKLSFYFCIWNSTLMVLSWRWCYQNKVGTSAISYCGKFVKTCWKLFGW